MEKLYNSAIRAKQSGQPSLLNFHTSTANHASEIIVSLSMKYHPLVQICSDEVLHTTTEVLIFVPSGKRAYQMHGDLTQMAALHAKIKGSTLYRTCNGFCFAFMDLWGKHIDGSDNPVLLTGHLYAGSREGARRDFLGKLYGKHSRSIVIPYVENLTLKTVPVRHKTLLFFLAQGRRKNAHYAQEDLAKLLQQIAQPKSNETVGLASLPGVVQWIGKAEESDLLELVEKMKQSVFCLVPRGDSDDTRRLFTAIAVGCIPIIISDWIVLPFEDEVDWDSFSFTVPTAKTNAFVQNLRNIAEEEIYFKHQNLLRWKSSFLVRKDLKDVREYEMIDRIVQALLKRAALNAEYLPWARRTASLLQNLYS